MIALAVSALACVMVVTTNGADPTIEKTIEKAKEKWMQELERAATAHKAAAERANAALVKMLESAAAVATKRNDTAKAESLAKWIEAVAAGHPLAADTGDKLLDGAITRRTTELEKAASAYKLAAGRATATLEKVYESTAAAYKRKGDARAEELPKEFAALKESASALPSASSGAAKGHQELIKTVGETLVNLEGKEIASKDLASKDFVLVYFSASWCGPCRAFTPSLVTFYDEHAKKGNFEVVLLSLDRSAADMLNYMKTDKMNWPAVPYARREGTGLMEKYKVQGIPHLVLLDKEGNVVSSAVENGKYVGPRKVLADLKERLGVKG
jgi:nucleoredoxin